MSLSLRWRCSFVHRGGFVAWVRNVSCSMAPDEGERISCPPPKPVSVCDAVIHNDDRFLMSRQASGDKTASPWGTASCWHGEEAVVSSNLKWPSTIQIHRIRPPACSFLVVLVHPHPSRAAVLLCTSVEIATEPWSSMWSRSAPLYFAAAPISHCLSRVVWWRKTQTHSSQPGSWFTSTKWLVLLSGSKHASQQRL